MQVELDCANVQPLSNLTLLIFVCTSLLLVMCKVCRRCIFQSVLFVHMNARARANALTHILQNSTNSTNNTVQCYGRGGGGGGRGVKDITLQPPLVSFTSVT